MRERAINIGQPVSMAAVLTEPDEPASGSPVFIILNSGVMHHVGACRLSVKLAREVAQHANLTAIRFDFSGIGDSDNRKQQASLDETALNEIREIIDYVESTLGASQVILCGLCSGAHNGFQAAVADKRVVGLIQFDGHCYPTAQSYLRFYGPRLFKLKHWHSVLRRTISRILGNNAAGQENAIGQLDTRFVEQPLFADKPAKHTMHTGLEALVERDVRLLLMFTGNDHLDYMYKGQFADCFSNVPFAELLQVEYFPLATHIFTEPLYQQQLLAHTRKWVSTYQG